MHLRAGKMLSSRKLSCLRGPHAGVPSLCPPVAVSTRSPRMSQAPRRSIIVASGAGPSGGSIMERLREDMKMAMKAKDQPRLEAIRFLSAALKSKEIEMRTEAPNAKLSDEDAIKVLMKSAKQRKDSIESYKSGGRQDLVDKEAKELSIIEGYLPAMMSEAEVADLVNAVVSELGATSLKDMGKVMGAMQARTKGLADNKLVSSLVQAKLRGAMTATRAEM